MKKYLVTSLLFLSATLCLNAQIKIPLRNEGGIYKITCQLNNYPLDFTLDTGCSDLLIPDSIANILRKIGCIKPEDDNLDSIKCKLADGSIVDGIAFNIQDLKIGSIHLHNVSGIIGGEKSSVLLGNSVLKHLQPYMKEEYYLTVYKTQNNIVLINEALHLKRIAEATENEDWSKCINHYLQLINAPSPDTIKAVYYTDLSYCFYQIKDYTNALKFNQRAYKIKATDTRLYNLSRVEYELKMYAECINHGQLYLNKYSENKEHIHNIYELLAFSYSRTGDYKNAISYTKKLLDQSYEAGHLFNMAFYYNKLGNVEETSSYINKAYKQRLIELNLPDNYDYTQTYDNLLKRIGNAKKSIQ